MKYLGHNLPSGLVAALIETPTITHGVCACCGAALYGDAYYKSENVGVIFNISKGDNKLPESKEYDVVHLPLDDGFVLNIKLNRVDRRGDDE